ncbi:MAG: 16S rRNA (cytidine(1402)-2'-O)-methyltransferase [Magnetococcales bacterium]|nr:16S rRNA (cytidine(1402)-2'-O)-methyltransferase [Magnetococcales bacterium]
MTARPATNGGDGKQPGILYLVPTPIGNLADITLRALEVLSKVSRVLAEDTRHTGHLLTHHKISTPLWSLTEHNVSKRLEQVMEELAAGRDLALVSDAGMPLVCDPGLPLVQEVIRRDWPLSVLPGACAPVTALAASGFAGDSFIFEGFLPKKSGQRVARLQKSMQENRTIVLFESPHRLLDLLKELTTLLPAGRQVVVAREMTKLYESYHRGDAATLLQHFQDEPPRGEIVVVIEGGEGIPASPEEVDEQLRSLLPTLGTREAARQVALQCGLSRSQVYQRALALTREEGQEG